MLIAVAGPYSADTSDERQHNLDVMNKAAASVMKLGHIPVIGVNAALPVVEFLGAGCKSIRGHHDNLAGPRRKMRRDSGAW